jgi:hypothetical protein
MKLRRSALQFTLRSLFVLTFLVALGLGWFMTELRRARTQTEAVSLVSRSGGDVGYRFALGEHGQRLASRLDDGFLAYAVDVDFTALTDAFGHGACRTVDADLSPLERLPYVETLDLRGAYHLTDAGFKHLEHLTRMRVLDLASTPINDGGLRHLGAMTHLQGLSLAMTRVSDFGLEHLSRLTDLKRLDLLELRVTDTGLRQLRHLTQLRKASSNPSIGVDWQGN